MATLNQRSAEKLRGVHPQLVAVVKRAAELSELEFIVTCGLRTIEEQRKMVANGASKTMKSKHITGHAVDLAPVIDGEARWDFPLFGRLDEVMQKAANELGVTVSWGGRWIRFVDGPHWELNPNHYPFTTK